MTSADVQALAFTVLQLALVGAITYAGKRLVKWLEARDANTLSKIANLASIVRWAVGEMAKRSELTGAQRKEGAINLVLAYLAANGYTKITEAQVRGLADAIQGAFDLLIALGLDALPPGWADGPPELVQVKPIEAPAA